MIDYHLHTRLCKHASRSVEEYVEAAIERGITEIAFTDHIPLPDKFDQAHRMEPGELDIYVKWIDQVRSRYREITIRLGIEADYYRGLERYTENILQRYDFDLVIISVHFLRHWPEGNWVFNYDFKDKAITEVYADYIRTVTEGIKTGLFDILGHIDLIKKPGDSLIDKIPAEITQLLTAVKEADMAIELNTSGYRKAAAETYPGFDWLPLLKENEIPITTGSDAHAPEQVGLNFQMIYKEIKRLDFQSLSTFAKRQRLAFVING